MFALGAGRLGRLVDGLSEGWSEPALVQENDDEVMGYESHGSESEYDDLSITTSELDREWEVHMAQIRELFTLLIVPLLGKWLGRWCSHYGMFCFGKRFSQR